MELYTIQRDVCTLAAYKLLHPQARASIFIAHGMAEHAQRYARFASLLHNAGFNVFLHDHRGHGQTTGLQGFFAEKAGWSKCVEDMADHITMIKESYPDLPVFVFGHSMGSFLTQEYLIRYSNLVQGAILCGSNGKNPPIAKVGYIIARLEALFRGPKALATLSEKISSFEFNKHFRPLNTPHDWLTRDRDEIQAFIDDPKCGFSCTTQFWLDMLRGIDALAVPHRQAQVRKDLPLYIIGGSACAVGLNAKGLRNLINAYTQSGLYRVTYTIYPDARHELLNETNKDEVHGDILSWLEGCLRPTH